MATPKWNRVDYKAVNIPQRENKQQSYDSPVNNFDLALGRFRDVLGDYGAIQDRKTGAELARRTMGMTDPNAIRAAIQDGSLVAGLDPISVTENAYLNADARAQAILEERAQDIRNRTGKFALERDEHNFGRQQATERARDALIRTQQQLLQQGTRGDVKGQGDTIAGIDTSTLTPEALDELSKLGITDIGVPVRGQDIQVRGQNLAERNSIRNANARMAQVNQARQSLKAQQAAAELDAQAQANAYDISQIPESMQRIALESFRPNQNLFGLTAWYLDRYKQGKGIPTGDSGVGSGRGRSSGGMDSPSAAQVLRDDIVRAPRAPITESEMRADSLIRQAAGFDNTFPVAEPFQSAPANATEDQAISFYQKSAGATQHSEDALRRGWKALNAALKERKLDKRFSTAEKLQLLDQGMEDASFFDRLTLNFPGVQGGNTKFNIENVSGLINDVGTGANAANARQRSNVTNSAAEVQALVNEFDAENRKYSQLSNDIARANISDADRAYYNQALRKQANVVGVLQERLNSAIGNTQRLMEGAGLNRPPADRAFVPPSRKQILDQLKREREEAKRLRETPTNVR